MATLNAKNPTLLDVANMPQNKDARDIVNLLGQFNPILQDAPAFECNRGTYHETTVRTGLPTPTWGQMYKGIPATKGTRQQIKDTTGFLEAASEVDTRLVDVVEKAEDKASIRFEEAEGHLEAMAQEMAEALFYHNTAINPERPMGLEPRFNQLSGAENSGQVIDGRGASDALGNKSSIWFITWEKKACHLIYPKSGQAGIQRKDLGVTQALDSAGDQYEVYREKFTWHAGLTVRDWRYVSRVANIKTADLVDDAASGANLIDLMTEAYYKHYGRRVNMGKTMIYANTEIVKYLDYQSRNATKNLHLQYKEAAHNAEEVLHFRGIPIRETDALKTDEDTLL